MPMVAVSAFEAEIARRKADQARARRARYEAKKQRGRHDQNETRIGGHRRELHYRDYPFIGWDGEAPRDTGYSLFGSSSGHEICSPKLTTNECFDLLLEAKQEYPFSIFVWFGGRYDFDSITRLSIPLDTLSRLNTSGSLWWHGYRITEIPGKIYTVARNGVTAKIFEITDWFHTPYVKALRNYGVGIDNCQHVRVSDDCSVECDCLCDVCRIARDKAARPSFLWKDMPDIAEYMRLELKYMPQLMERVRGITINAGFDLRAWYGPSALARQLLTRNKVKLAMCETPEKVNLAAQYAFAGGRFEGFQGGIIDQEYWTWDQNSAYMHAALSLPNLASGIWRHGKCYEPGKFAIYHIDYHCRDRYNPLKPFPLFRRLPNGNVVWPNRVRGWYWGPEAALVANDPNAKFLDALVFDEFDESDRPFSFVRDLYAQRLAFQRLPESNRSREAEKALKWALAAIYGQLARRVGWDKKRKKPPSTHQLEWAGYILSACRAAMYLMAVQAGDKLVSIDTDSVSTLCPIECDLGVELGQWKADRADKAIVFQNGIYFTYSDGKWSKGKHRGIEKRVGSPALTPEMLVEAIRTGTKVQLEPRQRYITSRMSLNHQFDKQGWIEHPGNVLVFGGGGKRYHNAKFCSKYCSGDLHTFLPKPLHGVSDNIFDVDSVRHMLPWKDDIDKLYPDTYQLEDILWVNTDNIDPYDDEWLAKIIC